MKYYIYLGENPTGFVGIEGNVKKNFMIALDEEANANRIEEFLKTGTIIPIPKSDFEHYQKLGIDRKRSEVKAYLEKKKIPTKEKTKPKIEGVITEEEI